MDEEKLIELVRKYEFLYNLGHPKYMDGARKEVAWKEISEQLKQPIAGCKQRWQSLRDAYRRVLNKRKGKNGQIARTTKQWKYETEMTFLLPYFVERKSHDCNEIVSGDEDTENYETLESNPSLATDPIALDKPNDIANENTASSAECNSGFLEVEVDIKETDKTQENKTKKNGKGVKRKMVEIDQSASAIFMANLLDDPSKVEDELDRFFLNISDTVKKFSPYQQALAKNKIFTLVSEMELQQLASTASRYPYSSSQNSSSFGIIPHAIPKPPSPNESWTDQKPHIY